MFKSQIYRVFWHSLFHLGSWGLSEYQLLEKVTSLLKKVNLAITWQNYRLKVLKSLSLFAFICRSKMTTKSGTREAIL